MVIDPQIQVILNSLVAVVLTALVTVLTAFIYKVTPVIVTFINNHIDFIKSKLTAEQLAMFNVLVTTVVQDAQQRGLTKQIEDTATSKKNYALNSLQDELEKLGIPFDLDSADKAIEAAINQGLNHGPAVAEVNIDIPNITPVVVDPVPTIEVPAT